MIWGWIRLIASLAAVRLKEGTFTKKKRLFASRLLLPLRLREKRSFRSWPSKTVRYSKNSDGIFSTERANFRAPNNTAVSRHGMVTSTSLHCRSYKYR
eukprot:scaffold354_cov81-Skeletonema_dohrnii-CCMP3373.AAC.5